MADIGAVTGITGTGDIGAPITEAAGGTLADPNREPGRHTVTRSRTPGT
jgi:hypothetical protein